MQGGQPGFFDLEYSDEFNGDHLNTNKWVAIEKDLSLSFIIVSASRIWLKNDTSCCPALHNRHHKRVNQIEQIWRETNSTGDDLKMVFLVTDILFKLLTKYQMSMITAILLIVIYQDASVPRVLFLQFMVFMKLDSILYLSKGCNLLGGFGPKMVLGITIGIGNGV